MVIIVKEKLIVQIANLSPLKVPLTKGGFRGL